MISNQYHKMMGKYQPLSIEENETLLHQYVDTHDEKIAWKLVCHNVRLIYVMLAKKYSEAYLNDEVFSDALFAFYKAVTFYKKGFGYQQFLRLANTMVIGMAGMASYKRKIQMSGGFENNKEIIKRQISKDSVLLNKGKYEFYKRYKRETQEDYNAITPFEEVANRDLSEFCCKIINRDDFRASLTPAEKRGLEALLRVGKDAGKTLGVSRQRMEYMKRHMETKIKKILKMKDKEIRLILS